MVFEIPPSTAGPLMVFLGIMVSQSMPLLGGGVADPDESFVESKLLE
jgi:hypothetical protein